MDYRLFSKKLALPSGFTAPRALEFEDLRARWLSRADLDADLAAVNSSVDIIHQTRGGTWPDGPLDRDFDLQDLIWHEREFRDGHSFAYVVYDVAGRYLGCFYLNPVGHDRELTEELSRYDVSVNWWVSTEAYADGYYLKLYVAVQQWLASEFGFFAAINYENLEIPT